MSIQKIFFFLIGILLLSGIQSQNDPTLLNLGTEQTVTTKVFGLLYQLQIPEGTKIIKIKTAPEDWENQINFYISQKTIPDYSNSIAMGQKAGINMVKIDVTKLDLTKTYYLRLQSRKENANCFLTYVGLETNTLLEGEEIDTSTVLQSPHIWKPATQEDLSKALFIYAIGSNINDFTLKVAFYLHGQKDKTVPGKELFRGGYGLQVDLSKEQGITLNDFYLEITVDSQEPKPYTTEVKIGIKFITENYSYLYYMEEVVSSLDNVHTKNCFPLKTFTDAEPEGTTRKLIVTVTSHSQPLTLTTYPSDLLSSTSSNVNVPLSEIDALVLTFTKGKSDPKNICLEKKVDDKYIETTFKMQIFDYSTIEDNQLFLAPTTNGILTKFILPPGKAMTFRRKRFALNNMSTEINLHPVKGESMLYGYKCAEFPACMLTKFNIPNLLKQGKLIQARTLNEDSHLSIPKETVDPLETFNSQNKLLGGVLCAETETSDCVFYFTMYFSSEEVELVPTEKLKNFVVASETKSPYVFTFKNAYIKMLKFTLYCYTGDADLSVQNTLIQFQSTSELTGNKKVMIFKQSTTQTDLSGKYLIQVLTKESSYYSIVVDWDSSLETDDVIVEGGEEQMMTLTKKQGTKTYKYTNRAKGKHIPYVITLQSLNCQLLLFTQNQEIKLDTEIQYTFEPTPEDDPQYYEIRISVISPFVNVGGDEYICMFYTSGIEIDNRKDLILNDNVNHQLDLSKKTINQITYSYPFSYFSYADNTKKQIIIDISFYKKNMPLKVLVKFEGLTKSTTPEEIQLGRGRKLIYHPHVLADYCAVNQLCVLYITIGSKEIEDNAIKFNINIKTSKSSPIYLRKDQYFKSVVDLKGIQYFYTDIDQKEEGEIMVTFNKGSGTVYAKIIPKDAFEEGGWNDHIFLPSTKVEEYFKLPYDYFNRRIIFTPADTAQCSKGCELFIGVKSEVYTDDDTESITMDYVSEFTILGRGIGLLSRTVLNIDDYGFGSINGKDDYDVYSITIPFDANKIRIHLVSDFAFVDIIKGSTVPTEVYYDWRLADPNGIITISAGEKELPTSSLKGQSFILIVRISDQINSTSKYALKVSATDASLPPFTYLTSEQNEICVIDPQQKFCNMIRSVNSYEGMTDFFMAVETMDNAHNSFIIYVKIMKAEDFENKFTFDDLPKRGNCDFSSESNPNRSVLHFNNKQTDKMKGNFYIVISVYGKQEGKALFYSSSIRKLNQTTLNQNSKTLFYMQKQDIFNFQMHGGTKYLVTFVLMQGNGILVTEKDRIVFEDSIIIELDDVSGNEVTVLAITDELVFNVNYFTIISTQQSQLNELAYGKDNFIYSSNKYDAAYYFKVLHDSEDRSQVSINFKFAAYQIEGSVQKPEDFDINAYMTDYLFILEAKKDPSKRPDQSKAIKARYDSFIRTGKIEINIKQNEGNKVEDGYIFITFSKSSTNLNTYSKLIPAISSYPTGVIGSVYSFPKNNYYYDTIDKTNTVNILKLSKSELNANKMLIEYASCVEESLIDFSIKKYADVTSLTDSNLRKNDTSINMKAERKYGRINIDIDTTNINDIAFIIFYKSASTSSTIPLSYVIKYRTVDTLAVDKVTFPNSKLKVEYVENTRVVKSSWIPPVISKKEGEEMKIIDYVFKITNKGLTQPKSTSPSICLLMDTNVKGLTKKVSHLENVAAVNIEESIDFTDGSYVDVSAVVLLLDEIDEEKMYSYDLSQFKIPGGETPKPPKPDNPGDDKDKDKTSTNNYNIYYIVGGVVLAIIIGAVAFYFIYRHRKMKQNGAEQQEILGGPTMPLIE